MPKLGFGGSPPAVWALPGCDRLTRTDRLVRAARRGRAWTLCHVARHDWARHRNPDVGGRRALFELCRRCGTERDEYDPPHFV
jgi:hypothetical protein